MIELLKLVTNPNINIPVMTILIVVFFSIKIITLIVNSRKNTSVQSTTKNYNNPFHLTPCSKEHELIKGKLDLIAERLDQVQDKLDQLNNNQKEINNNLFEIHTDMIKMINEITNSLQELVHIIRTIEK